jgi:hypothetical protein
MKNLFLLLFVISCAHKVKTDGGTSKYDPSVYETLSPADLMTYAQTVVKREERSPDNVSLSQIRKSAEGEIRRAALVVFETEIQPSRSGLASDRNVYLSARGKQLLAEELWRHWDRHLRELTSGAVEWVKRKELIESKAYRTAGSVENNFYLEERAQLSDQDVVWREPGKRIAEETLLLPAGMQDLSMVLIPAQDLMGGAKPSQHQHHWVNDLCKELNVDAVVLVHIASEWRRGSVDKRTQEKIAEEMKLKLRATTLYPWKTYHTVGEGLGKTNLQKLNVPLASYEAETKLPLQITMPESEETFESAMNNVINPVRTHLARLSGLVQERVTSDIRQTHQAQK